MSGLQLNKKKIHRIGGNKDRGELIFNKPSAQNNKTDNTNEGRNC